MKKTHKDLFARAAWTGLQAALGLVTVATLSIPIAYAIPVAWALSAIKSYVASRVGDAETVTFN